MPNDLPHLHALCAFVAPVLHPAVVRLPLYPHPPEGDHIVSPLRIEETPGHPIPETYLHRETCEPVTAMLVTENNCQIVAAWCGGRVAGRSVLVPSERGSWTAAIGFYVLQEHDYPVRSGADFEREYVLKSVADADFWARKEVLG